ncbi:MAG: ShlB/FhaC/HecB family hemolysin secretion/activation protein [Deltaproteobacteria bacterium]|jgi:hemolysin activation/secretion protein|nr:ShlB/FhaC/HecB family hemolysin secretion/activation protein [Deltaproteobacteria bacterium]
MPLYLSVIFFVLFCRFAYAAAPDPQRNMPERAMELHEQRLRLLEEEQRRSLLTPPPQEGARPAPPAPSPDAGACVHIRAFHVEGATLLSSRTLEKITRPHENTCLTLAGINGILQQITNAYIQAGYIASRALLEPQDLAAGVLRIRVVEGRVESIEPDASSTMDARQFMTIFPFVRGSVLNLRDIEQGLDQLNRLPSNRASMRIEPGKAPGTSRVLIANVQERTWRPYIGYDNLGQDATGRTQYTLGLEKDNFIGCNDQFALYYTGAMPEEYGPNNSKVEGYSESLTGRFSMPVGYWLLSGSASTFSYSTLLLGRNQSYTSQGTSVAARIALDRVIFRDGDSKLSLGAFYQYRDINNYIEEERLLASSYRLSSAGLALTYTRRMLGGVMSLSLEQAWGIPSMSEAIPFDSPASAPKTNFSKSSASLQWYYPFALAGQSFAWTLSARGQIADVTLYNSERLYLGGLYSVRGFQNSVLSGNQGGYMRNELAWNVPQTWHAFAGSPIRNVQLFAAYDTGALVQRDSYERGYISGVAGGIRISGALALELAYAHPLEAPSFVRKSEKRDTWYLSVKYTL